MLGSLQLDDVGRWRLYYVEDVPRPKFSYVAHFRPVLVLVVSPFHQVFLAMGEIHLNGLVENMSMIFGHTRFEVVPEPMVVPVA